MFALDIKKLRLAILTDQPRPVTDGNGGEVVRDGQTIAYFVLLLVPVTGSPVTVQAKGPMPKGELQAGVVTVEGLEAVPYELRKSGKVERDGVAYRVGAVRPVAAA
jgi:hypothetical protein